jgi:serine/threonine-protein kinase
MQTIGRYQLSEKLGQGGMGVVYRAFDTLLERVVAVKIISAQIDTHPDTRERFFREARAAGQLSHPNIITIHDLGEEDGHPFLAMEYLHGEDLQQRLSGPVKISLARKIELAIEICQGLEHAHAHGVVHRDVKPANIFITTSGQVKILDFGLARLMSSQLTNSNMLMGTLNYMAPELVRAERADHRADIFSAGVVMYELLGGRKAFEGDSFASTLYKILQEVPEPLWQIDPSLPRELAAIVDAALAKPPDERYQTISALRQDLELFRGELQDSGGGISVRPASGPPRTGAMRPATPQPFTPSTPPPLAPSTPPPLRPASGEVPAFPAPASDAPHPAPGMTRRTMAIIAAAIVIAAAAGTVWRGVQRQRPPQAPATPVPAAQDRGAATAQARARAEQALAVQDYAGAQQHARAALEQNPEDPDARRILDRARNAAASIESGLENARGAYAAADYQAASRAAGDVLTLAPQNGEARQILEQSAARSRGRSAADARRRVAEAKDTARAARAPALAAPAYRTAVRAEQDAARLFSLDRLAEATARYYEASGLYQSAAMSAQAAAAPAATPPVAPSNAAPPSASGPDQSATAQLPKPDPSAAPQASQPNQPEAGQPPKVEESQAPPPATVAAPPPAPALPSAPPPAAPDNPARGTPPEEGIAQLLAQYEAALEAKDLDALKRLWPRLGGAPADALRAEFQHASRITVEIIDPRISATNGTGTVTFRRRYELRTVDGQRLRSESQTMMDVRRTPQGWIIDSVRFIPIR